MSENTNDMARRQHSNINIYQHQQHCLSGYWWWRWRRQQPQQQQQQQRRQMTPSHCKKTQTIFIGVAAVRRNERNKQKNSNMKKSHHAEKRKRKMGRNETLHAFRSSMVNAAFSLLLLLLLFLCISSTLVHSTSTFDINRMNFIRTINALCQNIRCVLYTPLLSLSHTRARSFPSYKWYIVYCFNAACDSHSIFIHENCKREKKQSNIKLRDVVKSSSSSSFSQHTQIVCVCSQQNDMKSFYFYCNDWWKELCVCLYRWKSHSNFICKTHLFLSYMCMSDKKQGTLTHTHRDISEKTHV